MSLTCVACDSLFVPVIQPVAFIHLIGFSFSAICYCLLRILWPFPRLLGGYGVHQCIHLSLDTGTVVH